MKRAYGITQGTTILIENLKGKDYLGDLGVDRRIMLKWIWRLWTGIRWFNIGSSAGPRMELRVP
jgi:hypothetical protein